MPGGFPFGAAGGGGGGVSAAGGSRQQPTYVWDLLPYSRRGVGLSASGNSHQQQPGSADPAADASGATLASSAPGSEQKQQQPPPPRQLTESEASLLEQLYRRKVRESGEKYELVATFRLRSGRVHAYHVYRTRVPFQLTERRKKLLREYYSQGCQDVALYVNQAEFEHYMPLSGSFKKPHGGEPRATPAGELSSSVTQTRSVNGLKSFLGIT